MSSNSVDSDEMTVEDENRSNLETDDIHRILENFMQSKEETLEELVGGFTYLTMDDVMQRASNTARALASNSNTGVFRGGDADTPSMLKGVAAPECLEVKVDSKRGEQEGSGEQSDGIEEEVLEAGPRSEGRGGDALFRHRPAALTKFDNFMLDDEEPGSDIVKEDGDESRVNKEEGVGEEEGEEEEDWLPTSGYMASFAADGTSPQEPQTMDTPAASNSKPAIQQKPAEAASLSSHTTRSQRMALDPDPRSQPQAAGVTDVVTSDGGQSSRASLTMSDTADTVCDSSSAVCHSSSAVCDSSSTVCDSSSAVCDSSSAVCDSSSAVCDDDVEAPAAWTLNPGEAEEEITALPVEQRVSVIEISARVVSSLDAGHSGGDAGSQAGEEEECSDDVVPFQLEEDYDYDNIVYTPKFTPQEMSYLNSFLPQKS